MAASTEVRTLRTEWKNGYDQCLDCGELIERESKWLGEDKNGKGWFQLHERCIRCGRFRSKKVPE